MAKAKGHRVARAYQSVQYECKSKIYCWLAGYHCFAVETELHAPETSNCTGHHGARGCMTDLQLIQLLLKRPLAFWRWTRQKVGWQFSKNRIHTTDLCNHLSEWLNQTSKGLVMCLCSSEQRAGCKLA